MGGGRALRGLLLEALEGDDSLLTRLGAFGSWRALATLWETGWLGRSHRSARATAAELRQRLREIAAARRSIAEAAAVATGAAVWVEGGVIRAGVEALLLDDNSGETARIPSAELRWIGGPPAAGEGDRVTVLGFAAPEVDPSLAAPAPRRLPRRVVIRSADRPAIAHLAMTGARR
jgi:hypothetical protein